MAENKVCVVCMIYFPMIYRMTVTTNHTRYKNKWNKQEQGEDLIDSWSLNFLNFSFLNKEIKTVIRVL